MIVVLGSRGQLGQALKDAIGEAPEHLFLSRASRDYCGDITDTAGLTETLMDIRPNIIINAAAFTAVDLAEQEMEAAMAANAKAPGVMAQIAAKINALLIHYSTDYVFDGSGQKPWEETDACAPLSVYGKSKLLGEQAISASGAKHFILRASWVYSHHGNNFLKTMLRLAEERDELRVINDQWGVPTHADYLAAATLDLINLATPGLGAKSQSVPDWGIYHCAPAGETTWFDYARLVINAAKSLGKAQACKKISPITTQEYPTAARRPLNSRLNTSKLQMALGTAPPDWQEDVMTTVHAVLMGTETDDDLQ
ncbi:MAG: dTDP-4-dehydrorhamnose reductase [Burkholderiaceae bacterium]|nr:dTDP-4-dehydrorhamnose reductase [Burkholderiaceae bacterium]